MSIGTSGLGSLAQSARQKQLKSARGILLVIGVLTLVVNVVFAFMAERQVKEAIQQQVQESQRKGMVFDQKKLAAIQDNAIRLTQLLNGGFAAVGVVFIVFGLIVDKFPVPITIASLVIYIAGGAISAVLAPETILQGIILKIIIIVCLAKSIQSALAYEREKSMESAAAPQFG